MSNTPRSFKRKNRVDTITFPLDPNDAAKLYPLQREHTSAVAALKLLSEAESPDEGAIAQATTKVEGARASLDDALKDCPTVTFHLRALSAMQIQVLQTDHPPTKEQVAAAKKSDPDAEPPDHNPETFPPAMLRAACVKIEWSDGTVNKDLSLEDAADFYETSSFGDQQAIMTAIGMLNQMPSRVETLGKG
jgi:hypothetical protein